MKVVYLAEVKWNYLPQRHRQIATRFPPDWVVLFVEPFTVGLSNPFRPRRDGRITYVTMPGFKNFPQPWLQALLRISALRAVAEAAIAAWLYCILTATGFRRPEVVLVSNIYYARLLPRLFPGVPVVYDLCDHHLAFPHTPRWAAACFAALCRHAARIVISGQALAELVPAPLRPKLIYIGNGADVARFSAAAARTPNPPAPPILLYLGTLYEWFDFDLIRRVALAYPDKRIVLVGPVARAVRHQADALLALPNLRMTGRVPQPEADQWLAQASVCLIPFIKNPLTRGINPNKLYEYLAAGKPVVSSDFSPEIEAHRGLIGVARDADEFAALIETALAGGQAGAAERRRQIARAHDWQFKADQYVQLLAELAQGGGAQLPGRSR